ncbi:MULTISPECIES: hypothetical protein [unclassified Pseudonocardia]|uniref:hypothetical protein n=1 Tax=unclassified Pseudonocardia TaxID=2619320 RepID=UPI001CF67E6E|nr:MULTISPECIES: hypothetical protein [unclassified Pseudonocardia]
MVVFEEPVPVSLPVSLPVAAALSGLSAYDVWVRYAGLGGTGTEHDVAAMLVDPAVTAPVDRVLLARVLDAHLVVLGCRRRVRPDTGDDAAPPAVP